MGWKNSELQTTEKILFHAAKKKVNFKNSFWFGILFWKFKYNAILTLR